MTSIDGLQALGPGIAFTLTTDGRTLTATEEQAAIIEWAAAHPLGCLLINALAGSAKTSTLQFLCKYLSDIPTLSLAFNKRIADRMAEILPQNVRAATVNSIGHRALAGLTGKKLVVDTKKNFNLIKTIVEKMKRVDQRAAYDLWGDLSKTVQRAKLNGYIPPSITLGKTLLTPDQFYGALEEAPDNWFMALVDEILEAGIRQTFTNGLIDYDDQIYMSTLFGASFPQHPRVMVDEAQDLSPLNHAMLEKLVGRDCQLIAVGDPWQSIYAFRGADTRSMSWLKDRFDMHEMTLSVSFRCPIQVVRNAHWRVPHMKWPAWAIEGEVAHFNEWRASDIPDGAAIICRNNAPLMSCALALLRAGRGVQVVGTDLGPQLVRALKKLSDNLQLPQAQVYDAIDVWEASKLAKARNADTVTDRAECLRVFAGFGPTLGAAIAYCEALFASKGPIQLLSGHKAKGLEWETVFHLDPHRIPSPWCKEGEALEQEYNVRYVIETRTKSTLYFVRLDKLREDT